jgi:hypothetical protein
VAAAQYTFTHKQYSSTVHIYTKTVQQYSTYLHKNSTQNTENGKYVIIRRKKIRRCEPRPVFASYALAFALHLRKKQGKTSVLFIYFHKLKHGM